jgi:hypothetical protein
MLPVKDLSQKGVNHPVNISGGRRVIPPMIPVSIGLPYLLLTPLAMAADPSEADEETGGCVQTVESDRVYLVGHCYVSPSWVTGASLELEGTVWGELGSETTHLVAGRVRAFNFARERDLPIVVEHGDYLVAAYPSRVSEVTFEDGREVIVFSREESTVLNVSYESEPRTLEAGEGIVVGLVPVDSNQAGCSVISTVSVPLKVRTVSVFERVFPRRVPGGWFALIGCIALAYIVRKKWNPNG